MKSNVVLGQDDPGDKDNPFILACKEKPPEKILTKIITPC